MDIQHTAKDNNTNAVDLAHNIVKRLCTPYFKTSKNITMDNYFSSIELAEILLSNGSTLVVTLRKNKRCITIEFLPSKMREVVVKILYVLCKKSLHVALFLNNSIF